MKYFVGDRYEAIEGVSEGDFLQAYAPRGGAELHRQTKIDISFNFFPVKARVKKRIGPIFLVARQKLLYNFKCPFVRRSVCSSVRYV